MKKLIILALMLAGCQGAALAQQQKIVYPAYISWYNPATKIPDSVEWFCVKHKKAVGREPGFHASGNRPNLSSDYAKSGWDIGHNCDASDENANKTDEYNSFDFANTFPQRPNNNRRIWLNIEDYTRQLAQQYDTVLVKTSWRDTLGTLGKHKVVIPKYTIKELWYKNHYEKFEVPNQDTVINKPFQYYRTAIISPEKTIVYR